MLQTHWHMYIERLMLLPLIVYREADVIAFDCMADVIAKFSSIEQMLSPYLVYVYQEADVIAFLIILADVIAMLPYILQYQICILQW